jgi:hypothetical protein
MNRAITAATMAKTIQISVKDAHLQKGSEWVAVVSAKR